MNELKLIERQQLPRYLQVFNRYTDQPLGYLGNASAQTLLLISDLPLMVNADFQLRLKAPDEQTGAVRNIDLNATCLWCREDQMPGVYDSGFRVQHASPDYLVLIQMLEQYFSFRWLNASA